MRTKDLVNLEEAYMSVFEAAYIPRTSSVGNISGLSDPSKIEVRRKESEKAIEDDFAKIATNKDDYNAITDILNLMTQLDLDVYTIDGKTYSAEELYKKILEDTKTPQHDYELLTHNTITAYKAAGGSEAFYHVYKEIFKRLGMEAAPYTRRETATKSAVVFYFGQDGQPYKTTLKIGDDEMIVGSGFWRDNRPQGMSSPTQNKDELKPQPWNKFKPNIDGLSIGEVRDLTRHDQAATAFEKKFPPLEYPQYYTKR